ncbi:MAG TPA: hypothetical protein VGH90_13475 [Chthoniobacteraceae bacterium]
MWKPYLRWLIAGVAALMTSGFCKAQVAADSGKADLADPAGLRKALGAIPSALNQILETVEEEMAAGRLTLSTSAAISQDVQTAQFVAGHFNLSQFTGSPRGHSNPTNNAAIEVAWKRLDVAQAAYPDAERRLIRALDAGRQAAGRAWKEARKAEEVSKLLAALQQLDDIRDQVVAVADVQSLVPKINRTIDRLEELESLFRAEESMDLHALAMALGRDRPPRSGIDGEISLKDWHDRHASVLEKLHAAWMASWAEMVRIFSTEKDPEKLTPLLERFERTRLDNVEETRDWTSPAGGKLSSALNIVSSWKKMLEQEALRNPAGVREYARGLRMELEETAPELLGILAGHSPRPEDEGGAEGAGDRKAIEEIRHKLFSAASLEDLKDVETEIQAEAKRTSNEETEQLTALATGVRGLERMWVAAESGSLDQWNVGQFGEGNIEGEYTALLNRLGHIYLARLLSRPDVLQRPLSGLPVPAVVGAVLDAAAKARDWPQMYAVWTRLGPIRFDTPLANEEMAAVRSYLSGLNCEKAELWPEAVVSYKAVLRVYSDRAPAAEATARLRALKANHPEAFSAKP